MKGASAGSNCVKHLVMRSALELDVKVVPNRFIPYSRLFFIIINKF